MGGDLSVESEVAAGTRVTLTPAGAPERGRRADRRSAAAPRGAVQAGTASTPSRTIGEAAGGVDPPAAVHDEPVVAGEPRDALEELALRTRRGRWRARRRRRDRGRSPWPRAAPWSARRCAGRRGAPRARRSRRWPRRRRPARSAVSRILSLAQRVLDPDPPGPAGRRPPVHGDVASGVDHRRRRAGPLELVQRALGRPALDEARRVDAAGHRPRVEPAVRRDAGAAAELQHVRDLGRGVARAGSPAAAAGSRDSPASRC